MPNDNRDPVLHRYRRSLALGGWIAGVLLTVLFYNVTTWRPARLASDGAVGAGDAPMIQVGALPVT